MSNQTYSQVVGVPEISVDISKIENVECDIEKYMDIKTIGDDYNDTSALKPIINQIFEFQVEYYKEKNKSDFGKFLFNKFKEVNGFYKYEFYIESQMFKISSKKDKLNLIFNYEKNNVRLLSYNKMKCVPFNNEIKEVVKLSEMTDGATMYVIFDTDKNKWFVSTNHRIQGDSNYDMPETHKEIFLKECSEKRYNFDKFMNYLYSNKKENHVLMFSMRHHLTPIPLGSKENILKFIAVYKFNINDKNYSETFQEYKNSKFSDEELKEKMYSIINEMCSDTISYLDTKEFISYCKKDGIGEFIHFTEYSFDKEKNLESQIKVFLSQESYTFKGLMIYGNEMVEFYENPEYNKVYSYRPRFSINNQDNIMIKVFMFQLELMYEKDKEMFFKYYNDLIEIYDIKEIFENNKKRVYEFFEGILDWYNKVYVDKTHTFKDIPVAYRYKYQDKYSKMMKNQNFSKKIVDIISKSDKNIDITNEEDKQQLYRKLILGDLLQDYYEKCNKSYNERQFCQYGNLYNNIFSPILKSSKKSGFKDL